MAQLSDPSIQKAKAVRTQILGLLDETVKNPFGSKLNVARIKNNNDRQRITVKFLVFLDFKLIYVQQLKS